MNAEVMVLVASLPASLDGFEIESGLDLRFRLLGGAKLDNLLCLTSNQAVDVC